MLFFGIQQGTSMLKADKTLDIQGMTHPRSRDVIERTMSSLVRGQTLNVITSDKATQENIAGLCTDLGYTLINASSEEGMRAFTLRK
jgi:TusA-related sulfurtransferase